MTFDRKAYYKRWKRAHSTYNRDYMRRRRHSRRLAAGEYVMIFGIRCQWKIFGANGQLKAVSDRIESCANNGETLQRLVASCKALGPISLEESCRVMH